MGDGSTWWCSWTVASAVLFIAPVAEAQLLDRASSAVHGSDDDDRGSSSSSSNDDDDDDDHRGSRWDRDDGYRYRSSSSYGGGSYGGSSYSGAYGGGCTNCELTLDGVGRPYDEHWYDERTGRFGLRIDGEAGYAIAGAARGALAMRAELTYFHLFIRYAGFLDPGGADVRGALLGRIGAEVALVSVPEAQLRVGGAARHWLDDNGDAGGFDFGLSGDFYPGDPFVLSIELAAGMLGAAFIVTARAEIGAMLGPTEVFAGYHYEALFGERTYADLGGLMLGLRGWI